MSERKFLIVIGGATATGKTSLSIRLAQHFDTSILSCDSRQFYREMSIGTAKPTPAELAAADHHFVGHLSIFDEYSVGDFERDAMSLLEKLFLKKNVVILAGGSGLFIRALCEGLNEFPDVPIAVKMEVEQLFQEKGIQALQKELEVTDPEYFAKVDQQNPIRLVRALSVIKASGKTFSSFQKQEKKKRPFTPIYVNLLLGREILYERINSRVDQMMDQGLLEEARQLFPINQKNNLSRVLGIGYQELFDFFAEKTTLEDAVAMIKQNSRRYAKRQMTWFRKDDHWQYFHPKEYDEILATIQNKLAEND